MSCFLMKRLLLLALAATLSSMAITPSASSAIAPAGGNIRITADRQSYNLEKKRYFLNGRVTVAYQDMRITGPLAEVEMDAAGKPRIAHFFKRPQFSRIRPKGGEDRVVGDIIKVFLADDRYGAEGNVESHIATVASDPFLIRSDIQEFDNRNKVVSASGNVQVNYKGSLASSTLANVRMKPDGKAERVIFSGSARIRQKNSEVLGDRITVMVESGNIIAEQHVRTQVTLESTAAATPPSSGPRGNTAMAATTDQPGKVFISSDYQHYDKSSDTMIASGHVKILYGDYVAVGPKATFKLKNNDLDRILLTGRGTITENGRTITADKITITTHPKNFDAVGNVSVNFKTTEGQQTTTTSAPPPRSAAKPPGGKSGKNPPQGRVLPKDEPSDY